MVSLDSDACGQMVAVACQDAVFIIDAQVSGTLLCVLSKQCIHNALPHIHMQTHQQMDVHMNRHVTSITR